MAATPGARKQCTICGTDCAGKPRVKDPKGRYYCRSCYERAQEGAGAASGVPAGAVGSASSTSPDDGDFGLLDDLFAAESQGDASPLSCPACDAPMAHGAVICVQCGHNRQTGTAVAPPTVRTAPRVTSSRTAWPIVIGTVCIVFALLNIALKILELADPTPTSELFQMSEASAAGFEGTNRVSAAASIILSIWLALGGVGVIMRRYAGVRSLRSWSIVIIVLVAIAFTCLFGALLLGSGTLPAGGDAGAAGGVGFMFVFLLILMLIGLALPVFLLWWFKRPRIVDEIDQWS